MKRIIILISILFANFTLSAQNFEGIWSGQLDMGLSKLPLVFNIKTSAVNYTATMDSPAQGTKGIVVNSISVVGDSINMKLDAISVTFSGRLQNDTIRGIFQQGGYSLPLHLAMTDGKAIIVKKQDPQQPYPYISEDVTIQNDKAEITLAGTLTLPSLAGRFPAVVLVSGSGPQDRNEEILGHKPFLVLADYLTRNGIAVLRYDDRGVGQSKGDFKSGTTADFAVDAYSVHQYLKSRPEIDPTRIGIIGHSEGGLISFILAAQQPDVAFVVSMAGSAFRGDIILKQQRGAMYKAMAMDETYITVNEQLVENMQKIAETNTYDEVEANLRSLSASLLPPEYATDNNILDEIGKNLLAQASPWMQYFMAYDPTYDLAKIRCPLFAINGEKDLQVLADNNLVKILAQIQSNGNKNVKTKSYPKLNHLFQSCKTGSPAEYGILEETISETVMSDISNWILSLYN